ncbi:PPOX class F420-dependent oxidoreductase [Terrabacter aeriphilus]|uniref:PPOX class F420-dependent oxidoreductase n=1 Tax=Terrabacter aeriphilus TaxID=515662 RepID=A0ABP9J4V0_9MICO
MTQVPTLHHLGGEQFVLLTTYRRSGEPVPTPVWVLPDAGGAVVSTPEGAGKVKRVRRDPRVTLQACDRRGRVQEGAPVVEGTTEVITDSAASEAVNRRLQRKYGLEFRIFMAVEWILKRGNSTRIVLRITPVAPRG